MSLIVSVDVGSTGIVAVLFDETRRRVVSTVDAPTDAPYSETPVASDVSEFSAEEIYCVVLRLLARLSGEVERLAASERSLRALILTGQQHGVALIDAANPSRTLGPFVNWTDRRGKRRWLGGERTLENELNRRLDSATRGELGCRIATGYGGLTLFDWNRSGQIPAGAQVAFVDDYVAVALAGNRRIFTDPTMAASSGLFDVRENRWSDAAIDALELPKTLFPPVVSVGTPIGTLCAEAASATGLPVGLPILQGLGDNQASILGCLDDPDDAAVVVNYGTGTQVTAPTDRFEPSFDYETRPFCNGRFLRVLAETNGGRAYATLKNFFRQTGIELFGVEPTDEQLYERMNALAARVADDAEIGIRCRPTFFPSRIRQDDGAETFGAFDGISAENFRPEYMIRALLDAMADESFERWQKIAPKNVESTDKKQLELFGGGNLLRRCAPFRAALERRFRLPLLLTPYREEAAVGAAKVASRALATQP